MNWDRNFNLVIILMMKCSLVNTPKHNQMIDPVSIWGVSSLFRNKNQMCSKKRSLFKDSNKKHAIERNEWSIVQILHILILSISRIYYVHELESNQINSNSKNMFDFILFLLQGFSVL